MIIRELVKLRIINSIEKVNPFLLLKEIMKTILINLLNRFRKKTNVLPIVRDIISLFLRKFPILKLDHELLLQLNFHQVENKDYQLKRMKFKIQIQIGKI